MQWWDAKAHAQAQQANVEHGTRDERGRQKGTDLPVKQLLPTPPVESESDKRVKMEEKRKRKEDKTVLDLGRS